MEMLEPLKEATLATNKDKYPTLSKMMPYYDELFDHFEKMEQKATNGRQRDAGGFLRNEVDDDVADAADSALHSPSSTSILKSPQTWQS